MDSFRKNNMMSIEKALLSEIRQFMRKQGYRRFASCLTNCTLQVTDKLGVVAYIQDDNTASIKNFLPHIVINRYFINNYEVISFLLRHELLHKLLKHGHRAMKIIAKRWGIDVNELESLTPEEMSRFKEEVYKVDSKSGYSILNVAGDYEISKYYTDKDKEYVDNLDFYGEQVTGLLLERDHPDWSQDLTFEQLYEIFEKEDYEYRLMQYDIIDGEMDDVGNLNVDIYLLCIDDNIIGVASSNNEFDALEDDVIAKSGLDASEFQKMKATVPADVSEQIADGYHPKTIDEFKNEFPGILISEV